MAFLGWTSDHGPTRPMPTLFVVDSANVTAKIPERCQEDPSILGPRALELTTSGRLERLLTLNVETGQIYLNHVPSLLSDFLFSKPS